MKLHHRVTGTLTAAVFALTSLAPAATTPPQIKAPKTPPTVKAPPSPPKVPSVPKVPVVKVPSTPKVPVVPKVQTPPKIPVVKVPTAPKVPVVKTPTAPKVPVVKVPTVKTPPVVKTPVVVKTPAVTTPKVPAVKTPDAPKVVKTPPLIKGTTGGGTKTPGSNSKTPVVSTKTGVPATTTVTTTTRGKLTPVTGITQQTKTPDAPEQNKAPAATVSKVAETAAPATQMTIQGGSSKDSTKGKDNNSRANQPATAPEADETSTELLVDLGFDKAQAARLVAQTQDQDPATRATAKEAIRVRADARATQEVLESLVGEEQAAVVGQKLIDPEKRADTQKNLKLVLDAAANLQLTGVDDEKASRVIDSFIRNGTTDKKVIDEVTGRLIVKELTGKDVPQGDPDDADPATALDIARNIINAKGDLALLGVEDDDPLLAKAVDEIVKGRVTDRSKARDIVEAAAAVSLEKSGLIPPGKPGETLQDRLQRAAKIQEAEVAAAKEPKPKPEEAKKPAKKPSKPISLADSIAGRFANVAGVEDSDGPKNDTGSSPSVLELVFGEKQPRTGGPKGVKDGKLRTGITKGGNVKGGGGAGIGQGKGRVGTVGDLNGRIVAKPGQVSQPVNTGGPRLASDPDSSPVKDVGRSPVQNGTPVDNTAPPATPANPGAAGDPAATGNAQVAGEQDLPNTNPQQPGATDPAGSNMDTSGGTFTITDTPTTGADGTTSVNFSVSGSPGGASDGDYVTTYFSDGTYITERVTADGGHELVGGGEGRPPAGVKEGDSTNVVQGDQAVFAGEEGAENGGNGGGDNNNGGGGGGGNDDDDDDNNNDDNTADTGTPPATTEDTAATEAAEENDDTAEASQEGTPNPEAAERGSRSGRLAEATQGRLGGDEQRRQNKAIDQRKNGNGASTPTGDETSSGVLLTAQEKSAFAKHLGLQRSRGVTTPTGDEAESSVDIVSALEALAVRRGSLINPAGGIGDKGGSGQGFGKGGFTAGPAPAGPAPKGKQAADDDEFGPAPQPGTGGATGAILGAPIGAPPTGVNANGAAASQALKGAVRVNSSQVQQNVGR